MEDEVELKKLNEIISKLSENENNNRTVGTIGSIASIVGTVAASSFAYGNIAGIASLLIPGGIAIAGAALLSGILVKKVNTDSTIRSFLDVIEETKGDQKKIDILKSRFDSIDSKNVDISQIRGIIDEVRNVE